MSVILCPCMRSVSGQSYTKDSNKSFLWTFSHYVWLKLLLLCCSCYWNHKTTKWGTSIKPEVFFSDLQHHLRDSVKFTVTVVRFSSLRKKFVQQGWYGCFKPFKMLEFIVMGVQDLTDTSILDKALDKVLKILECFQPGCIAIKVGSHKSSISSFHFIRISSPFAFTKMNFGCL